MADKKISDAELEILEVLWSAGEALSANEIRIRLNHSTHTDQTAFRQRCDFSGKAGSVLLYAMHGAQCLCEGGDQELCQ